MVRDMATGGPTLTGNLICFCAMAAWAIGFPAAELLLESWGVLALIAARMAIGTAAMVLIWWLIEGRMAIRSAPWAPGILIGGVGFGIGATLLLAGQALSDPITTAIAAATTPIAGAVLEFLNDRRRPTPGLIVGVLCALIGAAIAVGPDLTSVGFGLGAGLCLMSVATYAWGTQATTGKLRVSPLAQAAVTSVGAVVFTCSAWGLAALLGLETAVIGAVDGEAWSLLLIYAIAAFTVSQTLWLWGAGRLGILLASLHINAVPFYVMIVGVLALGASWSATQAFGALVVGAGVVVAQIRPSPCGDVALEGKA